MIEAAAAGSAGEPPSEPSRTELARWVKGLPAADKDAYLLRFLTEEGDLLLRAELSKRFREATVPKGTRPTPGVERRTATQLLAAHDALVEEKRRKSAERAVRERARREREQAEARAKYLDELAHREPATWREIDELIATKRPKECAGNNFPVFPKYVIKPSARSQTGRRAAWTPMHRKSNGR